MSKKFSNIDDEVLIDQVREFPCLYHHENKDFKDFQIRENIWSQIGKVLSKRSEECKLRWKHIRDNYLKQKRKLKLGTGSAASTRPPKWHLFQQLTFLEGVKSERSRIQNASQDEESQNEESQHSSNLVDEVSQSSHDLDDDEVNDSASQNPSETIGSLPKTPQFTGINPKRIKLSSESSIHSSDALSTKSLAPRTQSTKVKLLHNLEEQSNRRMKMLSQLTSTKREDDEIDLFMKSIALTIKKLPPYKISQAKIQILTLVSNLEMPSESTESPSTMTSSQTSLPSTSVLAENFSILPLEEPTTPSGSSYTILTATPVAYNNNTSSYSLCENNFH